MMNVEMLCMESPALFSIEEFMLQGNPDSMMSMEVFRQWLDLGYINNRKREEREDAGEEEEGKESIVVPTHISYRQDPSFGSWMFTGSRDGPIATAARVA
ncbi:hypothetical protein GH733_016807 [Mirounga leonina]|nr:hypothetical protein GH733_016807 [Mirounga leonina]